MNSNDRFIVDIPGITVDRIRDGRVERFMSASGVRYANMKIEHVEALERLLAHVTEQMVQLGQKG